MTKVFLTYYKKNKKISSKLIESEINEHAYEKAQRTNYKEGLTVASDFNISWYCYPDRVRIEVPELGKAFYYKIKYSPRYANRAAERAGRVQSYTHEYKYACSRFVK